MEFSYTFEKLNEKLQICVSPQHKFGTDAWLLANFAHPRKKDICCDLGTGCGIIPLVWQSKKMGKQITAVDIQPQAIEQMKITIEKCGLQEKITPLLADLKQLKGKIPFNSFDVVSCNPPYKAKGAGLISENESKRMALHEESCTIEDVCAAAVKLLRFGGRLCICQRPERLCDVLCAMRQNNIEPKRLQWVADMPGRPPFLFLVEGKKGSASFLQVEENCYLKNPDGSYTEKMLKIYGKL